jgi:hypothetical protein
MDCETEVYPKRDAKEPERARPEAPQYTGRGGIEPIDFITTNNFDFLEGNVIKYVARYKHKHGVADLKKARDYLNWLIAREEGE